MKIIGIAGGSGAGKSTFVRNISRVLGHKQIQIMPQDCYYRDGSHLELTVRKQQNFDHPDAIEWELMVEHIRMLQEGLPIDMPDYSMLTCTRTEQTTRLHGADILIVEGILIYTYEPLLSIIDYRIFLDVGKPERYSRVLRRDMRDRGRTETEVAERFHNTVEPMYRSFIEPTRQRANIIVPGGGKNLPAAQIVAAMAGSSHSK
jgi:uridine kinase